MLSLKPKEEVLMLRKKANVLAQNKPYFDKLKQLWQKRAQAEERRIIAEKAFQEELRKRRASAQLLAERRRERELLKRAIRVY